MIYLREESGATNQGVPSLVIRKRKVALISLAQVQRGMSPTYFLHQKRPWACRREELLRVQVCTDNRWLKKKYLMSITPPVVLIHIRKGVETKSSLDRALIALIQAPRIIHLKYRHPLILPSALSTTYKIFRRARQREEDDNDKDTSGNTRPQDIHTHFFSSLSFRFCFSSCDGVNITS